MIELPRSLTREPGTWKPFKDQLPPEHEHLVRHYALITCPTCHKALSVGVGGHSIAEDGTVSPSVVCPRPGCTFHEFVRLADWSA